MIGMVITMYDEFDIVAQTINNCKSHEAIIVVIHSDNQSSDENLEYIKKNSIYILVSDLSKEFNKVELGSASVCRNYNIGFKKLYEVGNNFDFIIGITGDTLIKDLSKIMNITASNHIGYVLQAVGQTFHDKIDNPYIGQLTRRETDEITDIMPQFFVFQGKFAYDNKLFTEIVNINKYTSEENFGNEIVRTLGYLFKEKIKRIHTNPNVYDYHEGIELQVRGIGHTRVNL
ncbi:MAG: hypothetical protein ABSA76_13465 [Bacteroidales bacterium]